MKKRTKSQRPRQPRKRRQPRMSRKRPSGPTDGIIELRREIREGLIGEIRSAVTNTAHQLVEDEVLALVGDPWSRKGDSSLRRNGKLTTTIFLRRRATFAHESPCPAINMRVRSTLSRRFMHSGAVTLSMMT